MDSQSSIGNVMKEELNDIDIVVVETTDYISKPIDKGNKELYCMNYILFKIFVLLFCDRNGYRS